MMSIGSEMIDEEAFNALIEQKTAWCVHNGQKGVFDYPGIGPFLRQIAKLESANGNLHFSVLRCGEAIVAVHLGFIVGKAMYCYMPSYNSEIGTAARQEKSCCSNASNEIPIIAAPEFDFLRGEEHFKDWLSNASRPILDFTFAASALGYVAQLFYSAVQSKAPSPAPESEEAVENLQAA